MVKNPFFTVLLPTHNRADVIGYAISSVLDQTYKNFELLIVGDGCTDNTEHVVHEFMKKDKRIVWKNFPKGSGFGYEHRNTVLKQAKGRYVAYMGHDDVWLPKHLETHAIFYAQHPTTLIACTRPLWMTEKGFLLPSFFNTTSPFIYKIFLNERNEIPAVCFTYKRSVLKRSGYWIPSKIKAGDWYLWKRIIQIDPQKKLGYISTPTTINFKSNWRKHDEYLNEHLQILENIVISSQYVRKLLTIAQPNLHRKPQQDIVWEIVKTPQGAQQILDRVNAALDEIIYQLSEQLNVMQHDNMRILRYINKIKETRLYHKYLAIRKIWAVHIQHLNKLH